MKLLLASALALLLVTFSACAAKKVPQNIETEASLATMQWLDKRFGFVNDRELSRLLQRVTSRLQEALARGALNELMEGIPAEEIPSYPFQVFVINSDQPSALSAGGGVIFLTKGLIKSLDSEAELAAVISHEMAHHVLGHAMEAIVETMHASTSAPSSSPRFAFTLEYELSADTVGLELLYAARYDPRAAISAIAKSSRARSERNLPAHQDWLAPREANLRAQLRELGAFFSGTENSREFNHIRNKL